MTVEIMMTITRLESIKSHFPLFLEDTQSKRMFFCPIETCTKQSKRLSSGKDHYNSNHYSLEFCPVCADKFSSPLDNLKISHFLKEPTTKQKLAMSKEQLTLFTELHMAFAYFYFSCRHSGKNRTLWAISVNMAEKYFMRQIRIKEGEIIE